MTTTELFASAARPLASRFLKEAGALAVDHCLDDREYRSLHRGGQQYLFDGVLGFQRLGWIVFGPGAARFQICLKMVPAITPPSTELIRPTGRYRIFAEVLGWLDIVPPCWGFWVASSSRVIALWVVNIGSVLISCSARTRGC